MAIACDPHYAAAHFNLANLNCRAGEFERALRSYQVAIDIRPDFADAFVAMANALDTLGRKAEAVESYERALAINPGYAEVHFNLGMLAITMGRHDEAAKSLRCAVEIKPDFAQAHRALGIVLGQLDKLDAAMASHRRALALDPESDEILYDLAMVLLALGKSAEALQLIVPALERAPTSMTKAAFVSCFARSGYMTVGPRIRTPLAIAITEPWGTTGPALPPGPWSHHARSEDCQLRTPRQRVMAGTVAEGGVIRCTWPWCSCG